MNAHDAFSEPLALERIGALLRSSLDILKTELEALEPAQLRWRSGADDWCINEVVGHLIEAEGRGFAGRIRQILAEDYPRFTTWDQPEVARSRKDCERDGVALLREMEALRGDSLRMVEALRPSDIERAGYHPVVGDLTIRDLLHEWVFHDRSHLQQILEIVKGLMWSKMGNSRRFSAPHSDDEAGRTSPR